MTEFGNDSDQTAFNNPILISQSLLYGSISKGKLTLQHVCVANECVCVWGGDNSGMKTVRGLYTINHYDYE